MPSKQKDTASQARARERARNWTFVTYPESAPSNWRDTIDALLVQWIESPLHDADDNADGGQKKAHWHVLILFDSMKHYDQVKEITDSINATIPQKVASAKGLVRYMIHLDNPEKHQYEKSSIVGHGGADVAEYLKPTISSRYQLIKEMREWVEANGCIEFFKLFDYAATERFDDWFPLLCDNSAYVLGEYIKSRRHSKFAGQIIVDRKTGEIIE